jgi:hypothetical protein
MKHRSPVPPTRHLSSDATNRSDRLETLIEIKSFTYERSWYGTYYRQRLFSMQKMDDHIARMLEAGWKILLYVAHSGRTRGIRPFAKRDAITILFKRR